MPVHPFPEHTLESAPAEAQPAMRATIKHLGYLSHAVGRLATSPQLLDGFLKLNGLFETTTLEPVAREVVVMTIATRNGCHICVAMHSARLAALGASTELIAALRDQLPLDDPRWAALQRFTLATIATTGDVGDGPLEEFLAHGFTQRNALEVVLGIGAYTLSTLANRMIGAPLDEQLRPYEWTAAA